MIRDLAEATGVDIAEIDKKYKLRQVIVFAVNNCKTERINLFLKVNWIRS